jgi:hypothetical protein
MPVAATEARNSGLGDGSARPARSALVLCARAVSLKRHAGGGSHRAMARDAVWKTVVVIGSTFSPAADV